MSQTKNIQTLTNTIQAEYAESELELSDAELEIVAGGHSRSGRSENKQGDCAQMGVRGGGGCVGKRG